MKIIYGIVLIGLASLIVAALWNVFDKEGEKEELSKEKDKQIFKHIGWEVLFSLVIILISWLK